MKSVRVALGVLEEIAARQPIGVSELARRLGLPKSSAHRALRTLSEAGWIEPAGNGAGQWALSIKALSVGGRAVNARRGLRMVAVPVMEDLRRATEETIHLVVAHHGDVVLIERFDGIRPVEVFNPLGSRAPLHAGLIESVP